MRFHLTESNSCLHLSLFFFRTCSLLGNPTQRKGAVKNLAFSIFCFSQKAPPDFEWDVGLLLYSHRVALHSPAFETDAFPVPVVHEGSLRE